MKKPINLPFIKHLVHSLKQKNPHLQVILGPRQVGKTTTILHFIDTELKSKAHYVSAEGSFHSSAEWLREQWALAQASEKVLIIDEIQKCENWAETIKALWDKAKRQGQLVPCILLGSSSLQIQKGLTESLTGRFQLIQANHWNFSESQEGYNLTFEEFLKFGGYPGAYEFRNNEQEWQSFVKNSIVATVVEKDILQFHHVKRPALFRQTFDVLMSYPAQEISFTKLLGQIQDKGNVELIKHYLHLYEGAFLVKALTKYSGSKLKTKTSSPKILPLAPCLYYINSLGEYTKDERGRVFEALVGAQLMRTGQDLFYWREGKYEVDFVLKKGKAVWAIEVKSGRKRSYLGLTEFCEQFPGVKTCVISEEVYADFEKDPLEFLERHSV